MATAGTMPDKTMAAAVNRVSKSRDKGGRVGDAKGAKGSIGERDKGAKRALLPRNPCLAPRVKVPSLPEVNLIPIQLNRIER